MKNRIFLVVILFFFALAIPQNVYAMPEGIWTSHDTKQYRLWETLHGQGVGIKIDFGHESVEMLE